MDKYLNIVTIVGTVLTLICTGITVCNNLKITDLQKSQDNLKSYYESELYYSVSLNPDIDAEVIVHTGESDSNDKIINIGAITIDSQLGGISKVYGVNYYGDQCWSVKPIELYDGRLMKDYSSQEICFILTEYTLDCLGTNRINGNWYSTYFILVEDFKEKHTVKMLVFEFDKNDNLIEVRIYDEIQLYLYQNSDNLKALHSFDYNQLDVYKSFINKINQIK